MRRRGCVCEGTCSTLSTWKSAREALGTGAPAHRLRLSQEQLLARLSANKTQGQSGAFLPPKPAPRAFPPHSPSTQKPWPLQSESVCPLHLGRGAGTAAGHRPGLPLLPRTVQLRHAAQGAKSCRGHSAEQAEPGWAAKLLLSSCHTHKSCKTTVGKNTACTVAAPAG